jgi:cytochrome c-type biogenesis protein CcmH/NrfG
LLQKDRIDILIGVLLLACVAAGAALLFGGGSQASQRDMAIDKAIERDMAYQARISFIERLYAPVTELQHSGKNAAALLKLDELSRRYPEDAHGQLLRGEILLQMNSVPQAVEHLAKAVRMSADYVDQHSPLSRRDLVDRLLSEQLPRVKAAAAEQGSQRYAATLKNLYYLQGRLAGGCE